MAVKQLVDEKRSTYEDYIKSGYTHLEAIQSLIALYIPVVVSELLDA